MDGKWPAGLLTLVLPAGLIALSVYAFSSNPLAILGCLTVMFGGAFYLLTYTDAF
jgi:hypothetical protein